MQPGTDQADRIARDINAVIAVGEGKADIAEAGHVTETIENQRA